MGKGINWQSARARDRVNKAGQPEVCTSLQVMPPARKSTTPFPIVYARYANAERREGRQPLPPVQWIASLKNR